MLYCPRCVTISPRDTVYDFSHQGGDDLKLEMQEQAILSTAQRQAGMRFRSQKDVDAYEESQGMVRQDVNSTSYRAMMQDDKDEAATRDRVLREDGVDGLVRYSTKQDIQHELGWSSARFCDWEERQDAAAAPDPDVIASSIAESGATAPGHGDP